MDEHFSLPQAPLCFVESLNFTDLGNLEDTVHIDSKSLLNNVVVHLSNEASPRETCRSSKLPSGPTRFLLN